jgi:glycosyltransferase involved in cell wall biosynthesis
MKLSVLICSIPERAHLLDPLLMQFRSRHNYNKPGVVEIIVDKRGKEISIGKKRQSLAEKATGQFSVYFDDDDWPHENYLKWIVDAIDSVPDIDCIGIRGYMTTNGKNRETWCHRLGFPIEGGIAVMEKYGYNYVRPIIHFNPVRTDLMLKAGFRDMRYGEDMDYASRLNPLLTKEYFIDQDLFHYRFSTAVPHKEKYGITK